MTGGPISERLADIDSETGPGGEAPSVASPTSRSCCCFSVPLQQVGQLIMLSARPLQVCWAFPFQQRTDNAICLLHDHQTEFPIVAGSAAPAEVERIACGAHRLLGCSGSGDGQSGLCRADADMLIDWRFIPSK